MITVELGAQFFADRSAEFIKNYFILFDSVELL